MDGCSSKMTGLTLIIIFFMAFPFAQARSAESEESETTLQNFTGDFMSPYTTKAKVVFLGGSALALTLAILEDQISDPWQVEFTEKRPLGNVASDLGKLGGSLIPNLVYAAGMLGAHALNGDITARDRGNLMIRASAYAQGATTLLKEIIREPRPDGSGEHVSFPSGHATGAFSFASVIGAEHEWYWGLLAYIYAGVVSYSRLNDNRHYIHDVIGGATIGVSYGLGLFYRAHRADRNIHPSKFEIVDIRLLPTNDLRGFWSYIGIAF